MPITSPFRLKFLKFFQIRYLESQNVLSVPDRAYKAIKFLPDSLIGSVAASDAFFSFPDGIEELIKVGVEAIIQPGGSINDKKAIKAANRAGIVMVFTGTRHFRH